jgi:hypothetical protein
MLSSLEKGRAERDKDSLITILSPLKEKKTTTVHTGNPSCFCSRDRMIMGLGQPRQKVSKTLSQKTSQVW